MKINKKKLYSLVAIGFISVLSTFNQFKTTQASLTAPASYDINYAYNTTDSRYYLGGSSPATAGDPVYTRTADGVYYNYSTTIDNLTNNFNNVIPEGLEITMTFNRSNTTWAGAGPTPFQLWRPTENKIGSDTSVGTIINKNYLLFNNQTNKDYLLYIDVSSSATGNYFYETFINLNELYFYRTAHNILLSDEQMAVLLIPSYSSLQFNTTSTAAIRYFDAWYLKYLGVSESYTQGYDAGYEQGDIDGYADGLANNPNLLITGVESLIGMFVNFVFIIFSLEIFGVSILSIAGILFGIVAVVWILKTIRG